MRAIERFVPADWKVAIGSRLRSAWRRSDRPSSSVNFTFGGVLFVGSSVVVALAALNNRSNLLFLMFCLAVGGLVMSFLLSGWMLRRVSVERQLPPAAIAGRPFVLTYHLRNTSRRSRILSIGIADQMRTEGPGIPLRGFEPCLEPDQTITTAVPAVAPRRGRVSLDGITLETRFPFGLLRRYRRFPVVHSLVVFPALYELRPMPARDRAGTPTGRTSRTVQWLHGEDLVGLREYRQGDNPKWIYWRKSARTGDLFIHERRRPIPQRLTLVLDLRLTSSAREQSHLLEAIISAAATLGCDALERGRLVGLVAVARDLIVIPPVAGRDQRDRLLHELADLRYGEDKPLEPSLRSLHFQERWCGPACLLSCEDEAVLRPISRWIGQQVGPVEILRPGTDSFSERFVETGPVDTFDRERAQPV
jgi:uncharacterized protein (DUF58 family)